MKNLFLFIFLSVNLTLFAQTKAVEKPTIQEETDDNLDDELDAKDSLFLARPYLQIGANYVSQIAYYGRTEGETQYGVSPSVNVHLGKGWTVGYEGGIWSASNPKYAFSSVGLSKSFDIGLASIELGFSRWFFNYAASTTDRSSYLGEIDANISFSIGNFTIGSSNSILLGKPRALFLEPNVGWEISGRLGEKRLLKWIFSPLLFADYGDDVTTRVVKLRPNGIGRTTTKPIFAVLNYGLTLPISLAYKNAELSASLHYFLPQNTDLPNTNTPFSVYEIGLIKRFGF